MSWFEQEKKRFLLELEAVESYNRGRSQEHQAVLTRTAGALNLRAAIQPTVNLYRVLVSLEGNYPWDMPRVVIEAPVLPPDTPHLRASQTPCLFFEAGSQPWSWNPHRHTGVFALLAAWRWALTHDYYHTTGVWLIPDLPWERGTP